MVFTFLELQDLVSAEVLDIDRTEPGSSLDIVKSVINRVVRDLSKKHDICQASIVVQFPDGTSHATIQAKTKATDPTFNYYDYDGWPTYILSDGIRLLRVQRHLEESDGSNTDINETTPEEIDQKDLRSTGASRITHYRLLTANDLRIQFFPKLADSVYAWEAEIEYVFIHPTLVNDADIVELPDVYQDAIIPGAARIVEKILGRSERVQANMVEFREQVSDASEDAKRKGKGTAPRIARTHVRIC